MAETLYNGIVLPDAWPPDDIDLSHSQPMRVPYLERPPEVIPIDLGRQLFVDDFLLDQRTTMDRQFGKPVKYPGNPVFFPQTRDELDAEYPACAVAKSGGVWHDAADGLFKMWYLSGYLGHASYAVSRDGVHWARPELDVVPGTNHVLPRDIHPDSGSVWIDYHCPPAEKYKMLCREPNADQGATEIPARMFVSADGVHWTQIAQTGVMGDRSTFFRNPFRDRWVQSIRGNIPPAYCLRARHYHESPDFAESGRWPRYQDTRPWMRADAMDRSQGEFPQLYNLDAIAYESLIVGFPQMLLGPPNYIGERTGTPKWTELTAAYSRDGFHWHRPDRSAFLAARREPGSWEYGYVESSAGMCLVVGDELWFYYSAYAGQPERTNANTPCWYYNGMYGHGAVGLAKLRRDGFAALCARFPGARVVTRPVVFRGRRLFVNANTAGSALRAEVLDREGKPLPGHAADDALPFIGNSTCVELRWRGGDLSGLSGRAVCFRFTMDRGELYAFWVTDSPRGASGGYLAAGGPGLASDRDID